MTNLAPANLGNAGQLSIWLGDSDPSRLQSKIWMFEAFFSVTGGPSELWIFTSFSVMSRASTALKPLFAVISVRSIVIAWSGCCGSPLSEIAALAPGNRRR